VDDIAHDVEPGDVRGAARALARYWSRYPPGTVHLVVVDPGVGTARRALACRADRRFLVGPDNGVLSPALLAPEAACVRITEGGGPRRVTPTFHGRDLFAPAAAALATGRPLAGVGAEVTDPVLLSEPRPTKSGEAATGEVIGIDRFGSLTTNLPGDWCAPGGFVEILGRRLELRRTYGDVEPGELLALLDSEGRVEVAVRDGSAAVLLGAAAGVPVRLLSP
jgi:S-adenosylmethionine hydrolase